MWSPLLSASFAPLPALKRCLVCLALPAFFFLPLSFPALIDSILEFPPPHHTTRTNMWYSTCAHMQDRYCRYPTTHLGVFCVPARLPFELFGSTPALLEDPESGIGWVSMWVLWNSCASVAPGTVVGWWYTTSVTLVRSSGRFWFWLVWSLTVDRQEAGCRYVRGLFTGVLVCLLLVPANQAHGHLHVNAIIQTKLNSDFSLSPRKCVMMSLEEAKYLGIYRATRRQLLCFSR